MKRTRDPEAFAAFLKEKDAPQEEEPMTEDLEPGEEVFEEETPVVMAKPAKSQPLKNAVSPEVAAAQQVMGRLAKERSEREAVRKQRGAPRNKHGERLRQEPVRAPVQVRRQRYLPDHTTLPAGVQIKPGWVPRWVRPYNEQYKETGLRVQEFKHYDYEEVRYTSGDQKGQIVKEPLGVLMQGPPDGYMDRCVHRSPEGVYDTDYFVDQQREIVEGMNREAGQELATLVVQKDHGTRRMISNADDEF
jgi:hypothetical protein